MGTMSTGSWRPGARRRALSVLVAFGALVMLSTTALASNDPFFSDQWGLSGQPASINGPQAWCASTGGVLVGDIDTGADFGHQDLAGRLVAGARFTSGNGDVNNPDATGQGAVQDDNGHGTMTTGLMVANKDNAIGIAGIAPSSQALVVKVMDSNGSGYTNDVGAGIRWAAAHGARVLNISLGTSVQGVSILPDSNIVSAIQQVSKQGVAVAVSAGNNQVPVPISQYIQIANVALVAGATGPQGELAWYSTTGQGVNIYAPGGDDPNGSPDRTINIVSTYFGNRYAAEQGTSFAAPHVAGTLALLMSHGLSASQARQRILDTAVARQGLPELDAAAALGSSAGCRSAPAASNEGPAPATTPARPGSSARGPAGPGQPGTAAVAAPSPSPSSSVSPSPSPSLQAEPVPSSRALAHDPPPAKKGGSPAPIVAVVMVVGIGLGYGGLRLLQALR